VDRVSLGKEAMHGLRIIRVLRSQHLDGDAPAQPHMRREVDDAHTTFADHLFEPIRAKDGPRLVAIGERLAATGARGTRTGGTAGGTSRRRAEGLSHRV